MKEKIEPWISKALKDLDRISRLHLDVFEIKRIKTLSLCDHFIRIYLTGMG